MTARTILATGIVFFVLSVFHPLLKAAAQTFSVEATVKKELWRNKYIEESSFAIGDVLTLVEGRLSKYPEQCFANIRTSKAENFAILEFKPYLVWKRNPLEFLKRVDVSIYVEAKQEEGKPDIFEQHGKFTLKPTEGADRINSFVSFKGTREEVNPQVLNDFARNSRWSEKCLNILRDKNTFVVVDMIQGDVTIRFTQHINSTSEEIDSPTPSSWKQVSDGDKIKVGQFKREATLIIAVHPKFKTNRSRVIGVKLGSYLPPSGYR